jgi:hypothetical protein
MVSVTLIVSSQLHRGKMSEKVPGANESNRYRSLRLND